MAVAPGTVAARTPFVPLAAMALAVEAFAAFLRSALNLGDLLLGACAACGLVCQSDCSDGNLNRVMFNGEPFHDGAVQVG